MKQLYFKDTLNKSNQARLILKNFICKLFIIH